MKRPRVIAEVVEPGQCRYFRKGQRFPLGGFTPAGLCASAYAVLARDAQTMRYGGTLPWATQGRVLTRCPDPQGALWQLQVEGEAPDAERIEALATSKRGHWDGYQFHPCRGFQGACPFSLVKDPSLVCRMDLAVRASAWW
ncbi:MAG: TIGR04076 family protein [Planctomycetes bacterium]|nr:TIGR04076 family protein [Planctomycetota bacterium]